LSSTPQVSMQGSRLRFPNLPGEFPIEDRQPVRPRRQPRTTTRTGDPLSLRFRLRFFEDLEKHACGSSYNAHTGFSRSSRLARDRSAVEFAPVPTSLASAGGMTRRTCGSIANRGVAHCETPAHGKTSGKRQAAFSACRRTAGLHDPLPAVLRLVPALLNDCLVARGCRVSELTGCRAGACRY
jgi:hypothetical protein